MLPSMNWTHAMAPQRKKTQTETTFFLFLRNISQRSTPTKIFSTIFINQLSWQKPSCREQARLTVAQDQCHEGATNAMHDD